MKKLSHYFLLAFAAMLFAGTTMAQTARVQIIHNAADPIASSVDVWLNDTKLIKGFDFRTATPFIDAPAEESFTVAIQPAGSSSPDNPLWSQNYTLEKDVVYILVANGLINPDNHKIFKPFNIYVNAAGRGAAQNNGEIDVLVFHGATDAPKVDIVETKTGAGTIVDDLEYGRTAGYLSLPSADYVIDVRDEKGLATLASYEVPIASFGLENQAISVLASGFLNPASNNNGEAFGLFVALASGGDLIELPAYTPAQTARVQVIHNAADAAAEVVDVWLNDTKLIENFAFRTATPFIDAPAGVEFTIAIQPPGSTSANNPIWSQQYTLNADQTYILIANGLVDDQNYEPFKAFDIYVNSFGREVANNPVDTDVLVFHGSTDAPTVDVVEVGAGAGTVVNDLTYGNFDGYLNLINDDYVVDVRDETGTVTVASYAVPLETLGLQGAALTVVASGFLNPANNNNGEAFGLYVALATGGDLIALPAYQPTARVQIIHNSADAAAEAVDVWLNQTKLIDNFAFRTATPFIDAPAGELLNIGIAPPNSNSWTESFSIKQVALTANETYIIIAQGIASSSGYNPAPTFELKVLPIGRETASQTGNTDVLVAHGSTDAPTVDVYETGVGAGQIVNNLAYGNTAGYLELATLDYVIEIRDETGTNTVAAYNAPLATLGLENSALTVLASGFLNPANNSNGAPFGLYVALASGGDLIALPAYQPTARVQVIHNAADAAAASVDVWLNDTKLIENFAFRTATPFIDAPAGVEFTIAIQPPGSTSANNPIWSQQYTLAAGETYVLVANGLVDDQNYEPFKAFDIYVYPMGREMANNSGETDVLVFHGSTDAPTVDVVEVGVGAGTIIDNFSYGDFAGYLSLPTVDYVLEVRDETGTVTVASYAAPIGTLGLDGVALSVVASGFLNPANNNNGEAFGLYVALPTGGNLIPLPTTQSTARVQVIHNAADAAAASVDVWLNDTKLIENFAFRTATPFIDAPAGVEFTIAIQPPGSTSSTNPIWSQQYTLAAGETYVLVANGLVDDQNYEPFKAFDIYVYPMGREMANNSGETDVMVFHGSTDAPTVDVVEVGVGAGTIIDNFSYGDFAGYLSLPTADYTLDVRDETGVVTVTSFAAPLATLGLQGQALTVVASGFLDPSVNNNGAAFGLYVALASGGALVALPVVTSVEENAFENYRMYPNPVKDMLNIQFGLVKDAEVSIQVYNLLGSLVMQDATQAFGGMQQQIRLNVSDLNEGVYLVKLTANGQQKTHKLHITR